MWLYIYLWFVCIWLVYMVLLVGIILSLSWVHARVHPLTRLRRPVSPPWCRNWPFFSSCLVIEFGISYFIKVASFHILEGSISYHGCLYFRYFIDIGFGYGWGACPNRLFFFFWLEALCDYNRMEWAVSVLVSSLILALVLGMIPLDWIYDCSIFWCFVMDKNFIFILV